MEHLDSYQLPATSYQLPGRKVVSGSLKLKAGSWRLSACITERMPPVLIALLLLLTLGGCNSSSSPNTPTTPPPAGPVPVVVVLGDSLTAGPGLRSEDAYPAVLQQRARDAGYPHRFMNAGVSGDTTADGLRRLDTALHADTKVLVVALGANDGLQRMPVETVKQNLRQIIERARSRNIRVLLCGMESLPTNGIDYVIRFHNIFPDLATEYQLPLMPFLLEGVFGRQDLNLPDGLHPNAAGMRVIASTMWPYLEPLLQATRLTLTLITPNS